TITPLPGDWCNGCRGAGPDRCEAFQDGPSTARSSSSTFCHGARCLGEWLTQVKSMPASRPQPGELAAEANDNGPLDQVLLLEIGDAGVVEMHSAFLDLSDRFAVGGGEPRLYQERREPVGAPTDADVGRVFGNALAFMN